MFPLSSDLNASLNYYFRFTFFAGPHVHDSRHLN